MQPGGQERKLLDAASLRCRAQPGALQQCTACATLKPQLLRLSVTRRKSPWACSRHDCTFCCLRLTRSQQTDPALHQGPEHVKPWDASGKLEDARDMQVSSIEALVQLGCEAAVPDSMAQTPLHVAAAEGHMDAIHALVRLVRPSCLLCGHAWPFGHLLPDCGACRTRPKTKIISLLCQGCTGSTAAAAFALHCEASSASSSITPSHMLTRPCEPLGLRPGGARPRRLHAAVLRGGLGPGGGRAGAGRRRLPRLGAQRRRPHAAARRRRAGLGQHAGPARAPPGQQGAQRLRSVPLLGRLGRQLECIAACH